MTNITLPKLTDFLNNSSAIPVEYAQIPVAAWTFLLGEYFFAVIFGVIGIALYMKTQNLYVSATWFIVTVAIVRPYITGGVLPNEFVYIIGILCGCIIGFLLFEIFIAKGNR